MRLVILFGSAAIGSTHPLSDVDIGVVFADRGLQRQDPVGVYGELLAEVQKHFPGQKIDLVYLDETAPGLRFRAVTQGRPLYEAVTGEFAEYRAEVMLRYFDFKHYENIFHASVLGQSS